MNDTSLSKPMKLQLFSALSCSARGAGNLVLAEKLFTVARLIARELYDDVDQHHNNLSVAVGFTLMAVACCARNRKHGAHYIAVAKSLAQQIDPQYPGRAQLRYLIQCIHFQIEPFRAKVAISIPRVPFSISNDLVSGMNHLVLTSLTQAFHLPISPSSCLIFSSCLSQELSDGPEKTEKINVLVQESIRHSAALTVIEFSCVCKAIVFFYSPGLRMIFEANEIKEEFCSDLPGAVPPHIAKTLLGIIEQLVTHITDEIFSFSISLTNVIRAYLFLSLHKFEQAIYYGREFLIGCLDSRHYDRILHSPAYLIAPEVFVLGYLFCRLGFMEDVDRAIKVLTLLEKTGYTSAISGLQVLRSLKSKAEKNPTSMILQLSRPINVSLHPPSEQETSSTDPTAAAILALFQQQPRGQAVKREEEEEEFPSEQQSDAEDDEDEQPAQPKSRQSSASERKHQQPSLPPPPPPRPQHHHQQQQPPLVLPLPQPSPQFPPHLLRPQFQQPSPILPPPHPDPLPGFMSLPGQHLGNGRGLKQEQPGIFVEDGRAQMVPPAPEMLFNHSVTANPISSSSSSSSVSSASSSLFGDLQPGPFSVPSKFDPTFSSMASQFPDTFSGIYFPGGSYPHTPMPMEMLSVGDTSNPPDFINSFWEQGNDAIISELEAIFHENIY